jgi:hypothetical protein
MTETTETPAYRRPLSEPVRFYTSPKDGRHGVVMRDLIDGSEYRVRPGTVVWFASCGNVVVDSVNRTGAVAYVGGIFVSRRLDRIRSAR